MRRLRQADLGHCGHGDARLEAAADRLVLGGVSDGHALQRDRRPATAEATGARLVQVGLAAVRQAAPGHGGAPPLAAGRPRGDRRDRIPHRTKANPPAGAHGRSAEGKMLIAGAVEVHDGGPRRVRLAPIADFCGASLHAFIKANVEAGATAKPDGWSSDTGAPGVTHDPHVVGPMAAHVVLPWTHRVFANLKTWALGVYHGLREKHLQSYLDEFVFRFNRRRTKHAAFRSLLGIAVAPKHVTYNMLIQPEAQA